MTSQTQTRRFRHTQGPTAGQEVGPYGIGWLFVPLTSEKSAMAATEPTSPGREAVFIVKEVEQSKRLLI